MNKLDTLTVGEVARAEKLADQSIASLQDPDKPKAMIVAALSYVLKRREDKNLNWAEHSETATLAECMETLGLNEDEDEAESDGTDTTA